MKTKKTPWINILAAPIIVAGFGLAGSTTVADHCYPTDVNQSGQVNIDDLLLVIEDWGEECELDEHDLLPSDLEWQLTEWVYQNPDLPGNQGCTNCLDSQFCQSSDHTKVSIVNVGQSGTGSFMHVQPKYLYKGPKHVADKIQIGVTVDISTMRNAADPNDGSNRASPALYLIGYGDGTGSATIPVNSNQSGGTWYYADAPDPAHCGFGDGISTPPVKVAELDLFEMGYANVGPNVSGYQGTINLVQITSHAAPNAGTDQSGTYIGLQDYGIKDLAGGDACPSEASAQLLDAINPDGSKDNFMGLDVTAPFHMEYTIFQGGMDIVISQQNTSFVGPKTIQFRGDKGQGITDFLHYQYFGIVVNINNSYGPEQWDSQHTDCKLQPHGSPTYSPGLWTCTFDSIAYMDGQVNEASWTACEAVTDYVGGINNPSAAIPTPDNQPPYSIPVGCKAGYPYPTCD